jgi:ribonuclease HIII
MRTVSVDKDRLRELERTLLKEDAARRAEVKSKHELYRIAYSGGTIVAYKTGKVLSNNRMADALLERAVQSVYSSKSEELKIGSDEAGKGEWLGPLVVAAVAVKTNTAAKLRSWGVMDSKNLSLEAIDILQRRIRKEAEAFNIVLISPSRFNEMFATFKSEGKNLNDLLAWGHATAIGDVMKGLGKKSQSVSGIVVDEFARRKTAYRLSRVIDMDRVKVIQRPRAEDEIAVASASILARAERELWIDRESAERGQDLRSLKLGNLRTLSNLSSLVKISYVEKHLS